MIDNIVNNYVLNSIKLNDYLFYSNNSNSFNISFLSMLCSMLFFNYYSETSGNNTGYSKFAKESAKFKISSKLGMLIIYSPAFITCLTFLLQQKLKNNNTIIPILSSLIFFKRILEVLFLHKYSGFTELAAAVPGGTMYAIYSFIINIYTLSIINKTTVNDFNFKIGLIVYLIGMFGNFYHHYILTTLRPSNVDAKKLKKKYVIPTGGLFDYVTCPHYFFECILWLGLAIISKHINSYLVCFAMTSYLSGRAKTTADYYKTKFDNYPKRNHIIPFIF